MLKRLCLLIILISFHFFAFASLEQAKKDSLLLQLSKTAEPIQKINILNQLASSSVSTDLPSCLAYLREMIVLAEKCSDKEKETTYKHVAIFYLTCNIYDQSYDFFLKAFQLAEKMEDEQEICVITSNIGGIYLKLFKFEKALDYFKKSLDMALQLADKEGHEMLKPELCAFYNNVGLTYGKLGKMNVAITYMEKAIELVPVEHKLLQAHYYCNIGPMYFDIGEEAKAFDCVRKSMQVAKQEGILNTVAFCQYTLASLYYQKQELKTTIILLDEALENAEKLTNKTLNRDIYGMYVNVYKALGNYKQALFCIEKLYEIKADLGNDDMLAKVTTLNLRYDFDKKEAQQELERQREKFRHNLLLIVASMLIVILILLYSIVYYRTKQIRLQKRELERNLELRNKELTSNVMYLMRNADMMKEVILRLVNLRPNLKPENLQVIKKVIEDLQALTRNDLWNEFETRFNRVHTDFYKKLQEKFPDLSPAELKMCAFLRLNMSSKEISSLTGITSKSVDVMRARIRKKLNISNTEVNLVTFLSEF